MQIIEATLTLKLEPATREYFSRVEPKPNSFKTHRVTNFGRIFYVKKEKGFYGPYVLSENNLQDFTQWMKSGRVWINTAIDERKIAENT